jgi:hypothetical protein
MEEVGTDFRMKTALKYWKGTLDDGGIFVNYDLDDDRTGDDGLVLVDSGYIVVQPLKPGGTAAPGVLVHTSKEVRIQGVSPTATAAMSCLLGWADFGREMLLNATKLPPGEKLEGWKPSEPTDEPIAATQRSSSIPPVRIPSSIRAEWIQTAAEDARDYLKHAQGWASDFIDKWQNGLTPQEITELGSDLGRVVADYWQSVFQRGVDTVRPAAGGQTDE